MPSNTNIKNVKKVWVSDATGRSLFGWKIKEEIFAIFFILVILALANDNDIVNKVSDNIYIQIFIGLVVIYCIYNKIPWSLAFILILLVAVLFSGFLENVKSSLQKLISDIKDKNSKFDSDSEKDNSLMHLGARVFSWISKDKDNKNETNKRSNKIILKKTVRFEDEKEESESEDDEVCKKVSNMFGFREDEELSEIDTDNETEPDTDRECEDHESLKNSLKSFMKEKMKK